MSVTFLTNEDKTVLEQSITQLSEEIAEHGVTPEMFGAVGDGVTDDTQAIRDALSSGKTVIGYGAYKITSTLFVQSDAYLRSVIYEGVADTFAFEIEQSSDIIKDITLDVRSLVSNGGGIRVINKSTEMMQFITVKTGSINAVYHGISFEAVGAGMQYVNVYIDGVVSVTNGNCLNFNVAHNDAHSIWLGEVKVFGGKLTAAGVDAWGVYCNGYSRSKQKHITAVRLIGCSLEQCVNGIYLHEAEAVSLVAARTEAIKKESWTSAAQGIVFSGHCTMIKFEGFAVPIDIIDLTNISKSYGEPPYIEFERVTKNNVPLGSAFVGADYRLKIRPYARIHRGAKNIGTAEIPAKWDEYTSHMPRSLRLYGGSHTEVDNSFDFFGECKLIVEVMSGGGAYLHYRMPVSNELVEIASIKSAGFYMLDNYFATLDTSPTSLWRITKLPHAQGSDGLAVDTSNFESTSQSDV